MAWTKDDTLSAFHRYLMDPETKVFVEDPTVSKQPDDLSMEVYAAYTDRSLFLAFRVHDQFVEAQINELCLLEDRQANDVTLVRWRERLEFRHQACA